MKRRYKRATAPFLLMPEWVLTSENWRILSNDAKAILIEVCKCWNGHGIPKGGIVNNNGQIAYGCRSAAKIDIQKDSAARALTDLVEAGFLDPSDTWAPGFTADGKRRAREFRVTFLPTHGYVGTWRNPTENRRRITLEHRLLNSLAYRTMPSAGKVVLIELIRRENGSNNGRISFGGLDGAHIGLTSRDITERAIGQVEDRGFIVETEPANKRRGRPRKWRLTIVKADGRAATMDFLKWQPEEVKKAGVRVASKNVNPVCPVRIKRSDGLSGADKAVRSNEPDRLSARQAKQQHRQHSQQLPIDPTVQNHPVARGAVYPHQADTYRKPYLDRAPAMPRPRPPPALGSTGSAATRTRASSTRPVIALAPEPGKHDPTLPPVFSRGTNQENWAMRNSEPRQLELFGDLQRDDPVATYYRRCRKSGVSLHYDLAGDEVFVVRPRGVPRWAVAGIGPLRDRVVADLLRVQYGVLPFVEPETLDGGCQLHRLPGVLLPELQPPVRQSLTSARRDPGPLPDELT